jgi:hypothetical protein
MNVRRSTRARQQRRNEQTTAENIGTTPQKQQPLLRRTTPRCPQKFSISC